MNALFRILPIAAALAVGCSTVRSAKEAQRELAPKGEADPAVSAKIDLRGRTLADLVSFALTNRPSVVSARLEVEDARLSLRQLAADAPLVSDSPWSAPTLSLSGSYSESSPGTTIGRAGWSTDPGSPSAALSLDLLIWDFGRYDAKAAAQKERVLAAERSLADEGFSVFGEVAASYFNLLEKQALLEVAFTNEFQYADHLRHAEALLDEGEANRLDVLKARLDFSRARQTTVSASNAVATAGATLMCALGVEASRGTCDEVLGELSDGIGCVRRAFPRTTDDVGAAFALARTNAPSVCVARARLRAASHDVDAAVADLMPNVSASVELRWTDPLWFWNWGVSAAQSLFQGFRKTTAVDRAVVSLRRAAAAVDAAEQTLSVQLETAIATRDDSAKALESARASIRSAKENLDTVREQYALGEANRIELSDAIAADSEARGDAIRAFYAGQRAEAELAAVIGRYPTYREEILKETK